MSWKRLCKSLLVWIFHKYTHLVSQDRNWKFIDNNALIDSALSIPVDIVFRKAEAYTGFQCQEHTFYYESLNTECDR